MGTTVNRQLFREAAYPLALIAALSCSDNTLTGTQGLTTDSLSADGNRVSTVGVSLASSSINVGDTTRATATLRDYQGRIIYRPVTWSSSDANVATVDATGLVTGVSAGTAQITATRYSKSGSVTITVSAIGTTSTGTPGTVGDLSIASVDSTSVTLTLTQVDDGTGQAAQYEVRYAPPPISWGSATATSLGTCTAPISGTSIGSALTCTVLGLVPSTKYDFQVIAFRGTLNQNAVFGNLSNIVSTTTTASGRAPVASVTVSPTSASVGVGSTVQLAATTRDASNNILTGRTVTWTTSTSAVATVSTSGVVTGVAAGTAQVTATSEGASGTSAITVTAPSQPGTVTNLGVSAIDSNAVVLSFTQVDDGTGRPASYEMRYSSPPIVWEIGRAHV